MFSNPFKNIAQFHHSEMTNKLKNVSDYLNKTGLKIGLLGGGGQLGRAIIDGLFQDDSISKLLSNQL